MTIRMRVVGWNVQPVIMADDGEELTPVPVQATTINNVDWQDFKDGGDKKAIEELRSKVENGSL
jgi:hypothetical protein